MGQLQFCETRMWSEQALSIKWNEFSDNIKETYKTLRQENDFSDVTLACEDGQQIEGHRIVLASSSSVLKEILKSFRQPHPLLYLRGVKVQTLTNLVDFIYHGEVDLLEENLEAFLTLAQEMKLKGMENDRNPATTESMTTGTPSSTQGSTNKRKRAKQEKVVPLPVKVGDIEVTDYHIESTDSTKEFDNLTFREETEEQADLSGITTIEEMDEKNPDGDVKSEWALDLQHLWQGEQEQGEHHDAHRVQTLGGSSRELHPVQPGLQEPRRPEAADWEEDVPGGRV